MKSNLQTALSLPLLGKMTALDVASYLEHTYSTTYLAQTQTQTRPFETNLAETQARPFQMNYAQVGVAVTTG